MSINFEDVLNQGIDTIEKPPLIPQGPYVWKVAKYARDVVGGGKWKTIDFTLQCQAAGDTVDEDELAEYGNPAGKVLSKRFMFNEEEEANFLRTLHDVKVFCLDHCQAEVDPNAPLKELLEATKGCMVMAEVSHRADKDDPEKQYEEIRKTMPAD
jgi:hypothetical protein